MANPEHLEVVQRGSEAMREWREKNRRATFDLREADLRFADFSEADLTGVDFTGAVLTGAALSGANLSAAVLNRAEFSKADLRFATLSGAELSGAQLRKADVCGADLSEADLREANLTGAVLLGAVLRAADLFRADLTGADLREADLRFADFSEADLTGVDFTGAVLSGANLTGGSLRDARLGWSVLGNVDLSTIDFLDTVLHEGPSSVGVGTLSRSKGRIPDQFLRGCGFNPWEILLAKLYDPALTPAEIEDLVYKVFNKRAHGPLYFGGVFISYSHADTRFVDTLYGRLQEEGASVWLDRHDLVAGPLQEQIATAIRVNDVIVLVLSESSIDSDWVANELEMGRRREKEERRDVICPVALDNSWQRRMEPEAPNRALWLTLKQEKNILDFSEWTTEAFRPQFDKLLRGLKIYYPPK